MNSKSNNEQFSQLFQAMVNVLVHSQKPQVEIDLVKIPTFVGSNQDPIEWLDLINWAFEANNILGIRRLAVAGAHLSGLAALWWEEQKRRIQYWDNNHNIELLTRRHCVEETVEQYALNMSVLFRRLEKSGNQYPEKTKVQMFVKGLRPNLAITVELFMPETLQEAIYRARICKVAFECGLEIYEPAPIWNVVNTVAFSQQMPQVTPSSAPRVTSQIPPMEYSSIGLDNKTQEREKPKNDEKEPQRERMSSQKRNNKKDTLDDDEYKVPVYDRSAPTLYNLFHYYQNETNSKDDEKESKNQNIEQHEPADVVNRKMAVTPDKRYEYQASTYHQESTNMSHIGRRNDPCYCCQNGSGVKKYEPKTFANPKKPTYTGHTGTTWGLERCYQNDIGITKTEGKVKIYLPNMDHFDGTDNPKPCNKNGIRAEKNESNRIEVERRKTTAGCETLKAACEAWKIKIKLFKA
ncbi:hypothetical protein C2G38_2234110 [Gigaspora rosea]|uniref:Retrotransposon gag domain-containing protein n=1 Tax=Gigaspora rosea TaxID=44941 RepID=A0A397TUY1_9GLOM|nr:hypothetical protein C2G38_2234110 [Gigaspora rosea]